jgi:predicted ribosomally synthesized peptide with SipW-like signal peptide
MNPGVKKILGLTIAVMLTLGMTVTGVWAYFGDSEASTNNVVTAGTLNLQVGATDPMTDKITLSNIKPADTGNAAIWLVGNTASLPGILSVSTGTITNNENGRNEVEIAAGDTTDPGGELGASLKLAFWMDKDKSGAWNSGDYYLSSAGTVVAWASGSTLPVAAFDYLNNYGSKSWATGQSVAAASDAGNFRVEYSFPDAGVSSNQAQTDSGGFDITFMVNQ